MNSFKWNTGLDNIPVDHQEDVLSTVIYFPIYLHFYTSFEKKRALFLRLHTEIPSSEKQCDFVQRTFLKTPE